MTNETSPVEFNVVRVRIFLSFRQQLLAVLKLPRDKPRFDTSVRVLLIFLFE